MPYPYKIRTYAEYLDEHKKYPSTAKCFVAGCNKIGYYEGGDARFYCGMCEKHASMKKHYMADLGYVKRKLTARLLWNDDQKYKEAYRFVSDLLRDITKQIEAEEAE